MMRFTQGNFLESRADALVNAVNTVGIMGKGIALRFKGEQVHRRTGARLW
jgi:O-acetyl-ADP-ribose deacetylase (regulator of RNase III)